MKHSVIQRLRGAQDWCIRHGAPYAWLAQLCQDAVQELESEFGALWLQWAFGPDAHVRVFLAGEMTAERLESLIEVLQMQRGWLQRRSEQPPSADAVDPALASSHELTTREKSK